MGEILYEKFAPLKQQAGKPREFTITLKGVGLSSAEQIELMMLDGAAIKLSRVDETKISEETPTDIFLRAIAPIVDQLVIDRYGSGVIDGIEAQIATAALEKAEETDSSLLIPAEVAE